MVDLVNTDNPWDRRKPTTNLTTKTPVEQRNPWEREMGAAEDIGNVAGPSLRTGVEMIPAGPAETSALIPRLAQWIASFSPYFDEKAKQDFNTAYHQTVDPLDPVKDFGLESVRKNITDPILGEQARPRAHTVPGEIAQRALEIGPSVFFGPGSIAQKTLVTAGSAAGGEGGRALAEGMGLSEPWQNAADIGGTLLGGVSPMVYNRIVNPYPIPPTRQPAVDIMDTRNVPLSVGQRTGNEQLLRKERMAGGPEAWDQQPAAFTGAAADTQGGFPPGTTQLTNRVMRDEFNRMGAEFDRLQMRANPVPFSQNLQNDLLHVTQDYIENNPLVAPVVENIMNQLAHNAAQNGGFLTGEGFQRARSLIGERIRSDATDPGVTEALMRFQDVLDNELAQVLSPQDQHAFRTVRAQYRNMLPIEYAKSQQGQAKREGFIDPQSLMTGIRNVEGRREVAAGERPMTNLAEAGGTTMVKPVSSGTAENLRAQLAGLIPILGAGGSGALASMLPGMSGSGPLSILAATLGGAAGYIAPKMRDAFIRSNAGQAFMGRNLAPRIETDRASLSALLALGAQAAARDHGDQTRR